MRPSVCSAGRRPEVLGHLLPAIAPEQLPEFRQCHRAVLEGRSFIDLEVRWQKRDGTSLTLSLALAPLYGGVSEVRGVIALAADLTERKELESQLRQSQKMEAIGQLAGGVAHDFNNLLTAIMGYTDLLLKSTPAGRPAARRPARDRPGRRPRHGADPASCWRSAAGRCCSPRCSISTPCSPTRCGCCGRLLGEHIELTIRLRAGARLVKADRGQIEQVIMNLAVNARDAMPRRRQAHPRDAERRRWTGDYASQHPGAPRANTCMLAVTDTGIGMDPATPGADLRAVLHHQGAGQGHRAGPGHRVRHRQAERRHICVYSEPGRGTTFKIYLPRVTAPAPVERPGRCASRPRCAGSETVLVVEDEAGVRSLTCRVLQTYGTRCSRRRTPGRLSLIAEQHPAPIDLLLTDVVLPRMSGRKLAERLIRTRPGLRVLYMSGYTDASIVSHGVLDPARHSSRNHLPRKRSRRRCERCWRRPAT